MLDRDGPYRRNKEGMQERGKNGKIRILDRNWFTSIKYLGLWLPKGTCCQMLCESQCLHRKDLNGVH